MAQGRSRPAWAEIDLAAVAHNAAVLARLAAPAELCAVVKAHGYGHGGPPVARAALGRRRPAAGGGAGRRGSGAARARHHRAGPAAERVRRRGGAERARARAHARRCTRAEGIAAFARRGEVGRAPRRGARQGGHRHAPGGGGARGPRRGGIGGGATSRCSSSRACGRTCPWPTATASEDRVFTERQLALFDRLVGDLAAAGIRVAAAARGQHGRRHRLPRARATTWSAAASASTATSRVARRCGGGGVRGAGGRRACCGRPWRSRPGWWRCARSTPASGPRTAGCGRCPTRVARGHGPHRLRRRRAAGALRRRLRGAHRRRAPSAGGDGDHGPDRRRLRRRRRRAAGRRGRAARAPGRARPSRRTTGRPCWERSATRWCAAWARACPRIVVNRPDAARWLTPAALERLRVTASTCTRCPLAKGRTQVVFGVGSPAADLLFVGEGPGREEDLAGEPFVGRSGKLLDRLMWEEVGLTRAECYIANVVKCRPPQNRDPAPGEIEACRPYLEEQIDLIDPIVIVTLGNFATKLLLETHQGHPRAARSGLRARPGQPGADVPPGLRVAGRGRGHGRDAGRLRTGQAAHGGGPPVSWPVRRSTSVAAVDPRAGRRAWPACAGRATSCSWWAISAPARPCSPRASPPRSG